MFASSQPGWSSANGDGPELYYWQREGGRPGEIDYIAQIGTQVIPIEINSGSPGAMKGLHQFMFERGFKGAVRCDANPPNDMTIDVSTTQKNPVQYHLINIPLYLLFFEYFRV